MNEKKRIFSEEEAKIMIKSFKKGKEQAKKEFLDKLNPIIDYVKERCSLGIGRLSEDEMLEKLEELKKEVEK